MTASALANAFAALEVTEEITLSELPAGEVFLVELDVTNPGAIRRRNSQFWLSREDGMLLKTLRQHGANTRFSLVPSGITMRFVPLDSVVHCDEGQFCVAQLRSISAVDLSSSTVKKVRP